MSRAALLLIQAAAQPTTMQDVPVEPPSLVVATPCQPDTQGDIVVCGKAGQRSPYRLPLPPAPPDQPNKVRFHLPGDIAGDAHLEQQISPDGIPDHRIMVHLSKKF